MKEMSKFRQLPSWEKRMEQERRESLENLKQTTKKQLVYQKIYKLFFSKTPYAQPLYNQNIFL